METAEITATPDLHLKKSTGAESSPIPSFIPQEIINPKATQEAKKDPPKFDFKKAEGILNTLPTPSNSQEEKLAEQLVDASAEELIERPVMVDNVEEIAERSLEEQLLYEARRKKEYAKAEYWMRCGLGMACGGFVAWPKEKIIEARAEYKMAKGDFAEALKGNFEPIKVRLSLEAKELMTDLQTVSDKIETTRQELEQLKNTVTQENREDEGTPSTIQDTKESYGREFDLTNNLSFYQHQQRTIQQRHQVLSTLLAN